MRYRHVATYTGPATSFVTNITDLQTHAGTDGYTLYSVTHVGGGMAAYRITSADQPIEMIDRHAYPQSFQYAGTPGASIITLNSGPVLFGTGMRETLGSGFLLDDDGSFAESIRLLKGKQSGDIVQLGEFETTGGRFFYFARDGQTGFEIWKFGDKGKISHLTDVALPTGPGVQGAEINDMLVTQLGDRSFIISASAMGNYVAVQMIHADGSVGTAQMLWADRGLGMNQPTHLGTVTVGAVTYLVVASAQSSSLTTMRLTYDGALEPVDHIIDERTTRFAGATALETVMMDGRAFIFVGGGDDGLSVFTMLPDGRLMHLETLVDTDKLTLADVSALSAMVIDGKIALFVSSRTEKGITQFAFDPGGIGLTKVVGAGKQIGTAGSDMMQASAKTTHMDGGAGDDILIAGSSPVRMTGGKGADTFVPMEVNGTITITDFELGVDKLDLSFLDMIRSTGQLVFRPQAYGIKIFYGKTVLVIMTRDKTTLQANSFDESLFPIGHYAPPDMTTKVVGTARNDKLVASRYGSKVYGLAGNDRLIGRDGNDTLDGGTGNDSLLGGGGHDRLYGRAGNDRLYGGAGNDRLYGGPGNDTLYGGAGNDSLYGESGNDILRGDDGNDTLHDTHGHNTLVGGEGNDVLIAGAGNDLLDGGPGNDRMIGGAGNDRMIGGDGNDRMVGGAGNDRMIGGNGDDRMVGGTGNDSLSGGNGNDFLQGDAGDDVLDGGAGNDSLIGGAGNDRLYGGTGNDRMAGGTGNDTLLGGSGNDVLMGDAGDDLLDGGAGNDKLLGGAGLDVLRGGTGNDTLEGGSGHDTIYGDDGDDLIKGQQDHDRLYGGAGNDTIYGGEGHDLVDGSIGDDVLYGDSGNDTLRGGDGRDSLSGGTGNDWLQGDAGNDTLSGDSGNDTLIGGAGNDALYGGTGNDVLRGGDGADRLDGGTGHDDLDGGTGDDVLFGGDGHDLLKGNDGNDRLQGGRGHDTLIGGAGADIFVFNSPEDLDGSTDTILDFQPDLDRIDLSGLNLTFIGCQEFSGAGQIRLEQLSPELQRLLIDMDGDGRADLTIEVAGPVTLTESSFLL